MPTIVQSVERAFSVLEAFDEHHPSRTAADIALIAGLSRPTTYRLLQTLQHLGYVRNHRGKFEITPGVLRLGAGYLGPDSVADRAQPLLHELATQLDRRVGIGVLDGDETVAIAIAGCPSSLVQPTRVQVGSRLPANATAMGRILLAYLADSPLPPGETAEIRRRGYVGVASTLVPDIATIAVPIHGSADRIITSLAAVDRFDDPVVGVRTLTRDVPALQDTAEKLSAVVG